MPTQQITDLTTIDTPGRPQQVAKVKADPTQENLVSSVEYGWLNYARSLPHYVDDATALLGSDLYDRMLYDATVSSCVNTVADGVLNEGHTISPAVPESDKDNYKRALEISDAANRMIDNLSTPADVVFKDMLRAMAFGNRVAEKVYEVQGNALNLTAVKVKPRDVFAFVVDAYKNVLGFVGLRPGFGGGGYGAYGYGYGTVGFLPLADLAKANGDEEPILLPRSKFAVLTHGMADNDPRGNSILRPAYEAWYFKTQMWPEFLKFLTQFAGPSLIALLDEGGSVGGEAIRDAITQQPLLNPDGSMKTVAAADRVFAALLGVRNGSVGVLSNVKQLEKIQSVSNGEAFHSAFQMFDQQISVAITGQSLSSMEGEHGSTSAGATVHQDVLSKRIFSNKRLLGNHVRRDWLRDWVLLNYGEAALPFVPNVSFFAPEQQDLATIWTALAALGLPIDPSQYADIDKENGLPKRSEESIQRAIDQAQLGVQAAQAGLEAAKNPDAAGNEPQAAKKASDTK